MDNSPHTPFFPAWRPRLAAAGQRVAAATRSVKGATLAGLENRFGAVFPAQLLDTPEGKRERVYPLRRTFWCFLWQILNPSTSGREVVRQLQALLTLEGGPVISSEDGGYCTARQRLPETLFPQALLASAKAVQQAAPLASPDVLQGRPCRVVDGTCVTMPDTMENRRAFPKTQATRDGIGFPMMRVVAFFCLTSGAILSAVTGNLCTSELALFQLMLPQLARGDILIADRAYSLFVVLHLLDLAGADFIGRSARKVDGRKRIRRLGRNDWMVRWQRPTKRSALLDPEPWSLVASCRDVRIVRGSLWRPGFRVRQVTLVTTLLDVGQYPADQLLQAYARRWRLELCFNDLKTTLKMEMLSCHSPKMIQKEFLLHLIAHNLVRLVAAQAARAHQADLERISFKGTLDALRQFCLALSRARSRRVRRRLWDELLRTLVDDLVPLRLNRREPRAIKRQKNKYPRLNRPRHLFRDHPKRNVRRSRARRRALLLN